MIGDLDVNLNIKIPKYKNTLNFNKFKQYKSYNKTIILKIKYKK